MVTVFWPDPLVEKLALPVRAPIEAATLYWPAGSFISTQGASQSRSEERRVGKEC